MIRNIAAFGCSWIHGDEIEHPNPQTEKERRIYREENCIVGQLGKLLGMTVENYGIKGNSLQGTVWEFYHWLNDDHRHTDAAPEETLVVVGLTESSRNSWWNNGNPQHSVNYNESWHDHVKWHQVYNNDPKAQEIAYWQTTEFFHNFCHTYNIKLLQVNVFSPPYISELVYDPTWNMRNELSEYPDMLTPGKHPNEKGAIHLANHLYNYAKDIII